MHCPSCKDHILKPVKLEKNLPARQCGHCEGVLLDLLYYRSWAEQQPSSSDENPTHVPLEKLTDTSEAMTCPQCEKLMVKYRISATQSNKIDVCSHCDDAWLDGGEWALLNALAMEKELTHIFTQPWQQRVLKASLAITQEKRDESQLGEADYGKVLAFRDWLLSHPKRSLIEQILQRRF